ncbi:lysosomal-associated transmembrane protein 4A-like [Tachypleus tridentatus]|uniref:lysosomal-associated transmembrane protein 4A-like n=1 Tax=Tachypleus tridentatus TaxID=6853 RepID=UPI003FD21EAA
MLNMRLKPPQVPENPTNFRCCFCCHVRTGTIVLGIWHLMLHFLAFAVLVSVAFHPNLICSRFDQWNEFSIDKETNVTTNTEVPLLYDSDSTAQLPELPDFSAGPATEFFKVKRWDPQEIFVALAVTFCTGIITFLLVYGAVRAKPSYLIPFFCLQILDLMISALTMVGYFAYLPNIQDNIENMKDLPFRQELLQLDPELLCALIVCIFMVYLVVKAYLMAVVWACYRYLRMMTCRRQMEIHPDTDGEVLLPPDYETASKQLPNLPSYSNSLPPSYSEATTNTSAVITNNNSV